MSLWGNLEQMHIDEVEKKLGSRAILIAKHRIDKQVGSYVKAARTESEKTARINIVSADIDGIIKDAADEFGTELEPVQAAIADHLSAYKLACGSCGCEGGACGEGKDCGCKDCGSCGKESKTAGGHADGCDCGFCANKGSFGKSDDDGEEPDDEVTAKTAAEFPDVTCPECGTRDVGHQFNRIESHEATCNNCGHRFDVPKHDLKSAKWHILAEQKLPGWNERQKSQRGAVGGEFGGEYDKETLDLGASKDAVGDQGAVKTDHKRVPEDGLKPVPIDSKEHPHEDQSVEQRWNREYTGPYTDSGEPDTSKKEHTFIDADAPIGNTEAIPTKTFQGDSWSTNPVTNVALSKWHVVP